jgi:hypothetical protein
MTKQIKLRCLEAECNDCEEVVGVLYCHREAKPVEVREGEGCRFKLYKEEEFLSDIEKYAKKTLQQGQRG